MQNALYFEAVRDAYEAYVIYCFLYFLVAYTGSEEQLAERLRQKPAAVGRHMAPFSWYLHPWRLGREFVHKCKVCRSRAGDMASFGRKTERHVYCTLDTVILISRGRLEHCNTSSRNSCALSPQSSWSSTTCMQRERFSIQSEDIFTSLLSGASPFYVI